MSSKLQTSRLKIEGRFPKHAASLSGSATKGWIAVVPTPMSSRRNPIKSARAAFMYSIGANPNRCWLAFVITGRRSGFTR